MMIDLFMHLLNFCQSCVSDAQSVPPAVGVLGGAAGAVGGLGGLAGGVGSGAGDAGTGAGDSTPNPGGAPGPATPDASTPDSGVTGGGPGSNTSNPFADESGGIAEHAAPPAAANPADPFVSPQATPDPLFGDGPQVDGPTSPGADSAKTDYINPDGTPLGSRPAAPHATPHKPGKP